MLGALIGASLGGTAIQGLMNYGMQKDQQQFNAEQAELSRQFTAKENQANREFNAQQAQITRDYNTAEAEKNRNWQENMRATQYQTQVEDMKKAGLNVGAMGQTGVSGAPTGATANAQAAGASGSTGGATASSSANAVMAPDFMKAATETLAMHKEEALERYRDTLENQGWAKIDLMERQLNMIARGTARRR